MVDSHAPIYRDQSRFGCVCDVDLEKSVQYMKSKLSTSFQDFDEYTTKPAIIPSDHQTRN